MARRTLIPVVALALMSPAPAALAQAPAAPARGPAQVPAQAAGPAVAPAAPVAAAPAGAPAGAADLASVEQLKQQLATDPQGVLRSVARLLALKGDAAAGYDRYDLLNLRGEAYLRNRAIPMAADAFAQAQKATQDADKQAAARAMELLVRRSKQTGYVPKVPMAPAKPAGGAARGGAAGQPAPGTLLGGDPAPGAAAPAAATIGPGGAIPIIEESDRKAAFSALFADELHAGAPKLRAAKSAAGLPPLIDAARMLGDLRAVELAATGGAEQTKQLGADIGDRAHRLIAAAISDMSRSTEKVWQSASRQKIYQNDVGTITGGAYGLWGMTSTEANSLKETMATCEKIAPVAGDLAAVTGNAALQGDAQEALRLHGRAREVLEYDYNNAGRYGNTGVDRIPLQPTPRQNPTPVAPRRTPTGQNTGTNVGQDTGTNTGTGTGTSSGTGRTPR